MLFSKEPQTPGHQKNYYFKMVSSNWHYSNQQSQHIVIWGLAFKSRTQNKNLMQIELQSFHIQFPRSILIWFSWVIFGIQTIFIHLYWQMVGENIIYFTRKSHKKSASNWSFEKYGCRELKVHIQSKFEILSGGRKEAVPLIHFIFFLNWLWTFSPFISFNELIPSV